MITATVNFMIASMLFGSWVSSKYQCAWSAGFFMANFLFGVVNLAIYFK